MKTRTEIILLALKEGRQPEVFPRSLTDEDCELISFLLQYQSDTWIQREVDVPTSSGATSEEQEG